MPPVRGADFFLPENKPVGELKQGSIYADMTLPWVKFFRQIARIAQALNGAGRPNGVVTTDQNGEVQVVLNDLTTIDYNASDFTADNSSTWIVEEVDIITWAYGRLGRRVLIAFVIVSSDITGGPTQLFLKLPQGLIAERTMETLCTIVNDGNTYVGRARVQANGAHVIVTKLDGTAFAASVNSNMVRGQLEFEVQI